MTFGSSGGWGGEQNASDLSELLISKELGRSAYMCGHMQTGEVHCASISSFCWGLQSQIDSGY